jgi:hypothetical protein
VAVTGNVPAVPTANVTVFALVIAAAWPTSNVKLCVALGVIPFCAVNVIA